MLDDPDRSESRELNETPRAELIAAFEALKGHSSWTWDSRFETALAQITVADKHAVGKTLEQHLGAAWDSVSIASAPDPLRHVVGRLGGIMPGQLLYAAALSPAGIFFCAWWPWGNGEDISLRCGTSAEGSALLEVLVPLDAR